MKHKKLAANSHAKHTVFSVPASGVNPTLTYKARVRSVSVVGPKVVFEWVIWSGKAAKK